MPVNFPGMFCSADHVTLLIILYLEIVNTFEVLQASPANSHSKVNLIHQEQLKGDYLSATISPSLSTTVTTLGRSTKKKGFWKGQPDQATWRNTEEQNTKNLISSIFVFPRTPCSLLKLVKMQCKLLRHIEDVLISASDCRDVGSLVRMISYIYIW